MILGIEASNIRAGGGLVHLVEIIKNADPKKYGFSKVSLWSSRKTLEKVPNQPWLEKRTSKLLNKGVLARLFWLKFCFDSEVKHSGCKVLFIPGGTYLGKFRPYVVLHQNLLPFEWEEIKRYFISKNFFRLIWLRINQVRSLKKSAGMIALSEKAGSQVLKVAKLDKSSLAYQVIPHGVAKRFFSNAEAISCDKKIHNLLYVSFIGEYKHQWNVIEAVNSVRKQGYNCQLTLIGKPDEARAVKKMYKAKGIFDPNDDFVAYKPAVTFEQIGAEYQRADYFLFASSCETFGQIVTEAMASGLPIMCSNMSAMPEILGDAGIYFNPLDVLDIERCIIEMLTKPDKSLAVLRKNAIERATKYTWINASEATLDFLSSISKLGKVII